MRHPLVALALSFGLLAVAACGTDSPTDAGDDQPSPSMVSGTDSGVVLESAALSAARFAPGPRTYEITIENLTPDTGDGGSQVFSPPLLATHKGGPVLFQRGHYASEGLAKLAEDGVTAMMAASLANSDRVHDVVEAGGPIPPGGSATYTVEASHMYAQLSLAFMLVNTNDGFGGASVLALPSASGRASYLLYAYDAGSEANTELYSDIPGPCCMGPGVRVPTHERIQLHEGITGAGDLDPAKWGWEGAVARLTIEAVN